MPSTLIISGSATFSVDGQSSAWMIIDGSRIGGGLDLVPSSGPLFLPVMGTISLSAGRHRFNLLIEGNGSHVRVGSRTITITAYTGKPVIRGRVVRP